MKPSAHPNLMPEIPSAEFDKVVLRAGGPVLVEFSTPWCGPCKALEPILRGLATEHAGRLAIVTVDGDQSAELTARYRVRGFPTVIAFIGGREVDRQLGLTSRTRLLAMIETALRTARTVSPLPQQH